MDRIFSMLSWWQMPISAVGTTLLSFLSGSLTFLTVIGIIYYIIHRL